MSIEDIQHQAGEAFLTTGESIGGAETTPGGASVLVTGSAGFIGFHVARHLAARGDRVLGVDNLNAYYDVRLKQARLDVLCEDPRFRFIKLNLADRSGVEELFRAESIDRVIHLAAQAGVRYSIENPHAYADCNLVGFLNVLEASRRHAIQHLVYASSSSVYGGNRRVPYSIHDSVDHPVSLYAATKRANELMAHSYSHLYELPTTGLRFFTVYGPWGRPDMAYFTFTRAILAGDPIDIFNEGNHARDFTFVDDAVDGVVRALDQPSVSNPNVSTESPDPATSAAPWRIYNVGNSECVGLMELIETIERELGRKAVKRFLPMQAGDVHQTWADVSELKADVGYEPRTPLAAGIKKFVAWYREYYDA